MILRVLLINPYPEEVAQTKYHSIPVLGIAYLAAELLKEGFHCEVIDGKMEGLTHKAMIERALAFKPDVLGITSMTHDIFRAHDIAGELKGSLPDLNVILGGPHATAVPEETLEGFPNFDLLILGEGETTIVEVMKKIDNGPLEDLDVNGIGFRYGNKIRVKPGYDFIADIDSIEFPAWGLFPETKEYAVFTSRGCPFGCNFCARVLGDRVRYRSPENVIKELEIAVSMGGEHIFFRDETFTANKKHVTNICNLMISRGLNKKLKWSCTTHCSTVKYDVLKLMKEAGCVSVEYGIESGNDEILKRMGKHLNKNMARRAVKVAKELGIKTFGNYIFGHPYETRETIQQTINFAVELNTTQVSFGVMVPYPGTEVYRMAKNGEGGYKNMSFDWSSFDKYQGGAIELDGVTKQDLAKAQMKAFAVFYFRNLRLVSAWMFFWENKKNILFYLLRLVKN